MYTPSQIVEDELEQVFASQCSAEGRVALDDDLFLVLFDFLCALELLLGDQHLLLVVITAVLCAKVDS